MDNQKLSNQEIFLTPIASPKHLQNWVDIFLDIKLPLGYVDPDSNSSPVEAMYEAYAAYRDDKCFEKVGFIWLSSRDSGKTLTGSILNTLLLLHFKSQMVHLAATKKQSEKALQYCNGFIRKLRPYIEASGRTIVTESKTKVQILNEDLSISYIDVIVANLAGGNCISPETIVWTKDGPTEARNINKGDQVLTYNIFTGQDVFVPVGSISHTYKPAREIKFSDGSNLIASDDHLIFTDRGWKTASTLRQTFKVTGTEGQIINTSYETEQSMFTTATDQLLLGTLLGDASIVNNGSNIFRYCVSHCAAQLEYLKFIKRSLEFAGYTFGEIRDSRSTINGKQYCTKQLLAKTHTKWQELRNLFYADGQKTISDEILNQLDWEGVAFWFMDDGSGNGRNVGSNKDNHMELAICGFDTASKTRIQNWFIRKGIACKLDPSSNSSGKQYEVLSFNLESSRKLSSLIGPYVVPCLRYKLLPTKSEMMTRTIDQGSLVPSNASIGMRWTSKSNKRIFGTQKLYHNWSRQIKNKLSCGIQAINPIGYQHLVDIHIDTEVPYLKSFYANSMKLIHNSEHVPVASFDELDTLSPQGKIGYKEAQLIPTRYKGKGPLTIKYSTRKFAFGIFEQEIQAIKETGEQLLRWNIIDITEHCPTSRHQPESTVDRWIAKELPLRQISPADFSALPEKEKLGYEKIAAYSGCTKCSLLPVCKMRLAHRPEEDKGGLFKEVDFTVRQFKITRDPDMAAAQLMCWKPSLAGLVYPRFEESSNVITLDQAYESFTGEKAPVGLDHSTFVTLLLSKGIRFYVGGDWGHAHAQAFIVSAIMPSGDWLIVDAYSIPGLEFDEILQLAMRIRDTYKPIKWFMDTSAPMFIKTFKKNKMPCADFTKDVLGGIECVRTQIIDASGKRRLKVIKSERTEVVIIGLKRHHFKLDSLGEPTADPDDDEVWSDVCDSLRYLGQNLFKPKTKLVTSNTGAMFDNPVPTQHYQDWMTQKTRNLTENSKSDSVGKTSDGNVVWDFGGNDD